MAVEQRKGPLSRNPIIAGVLVLVGIVAAILLVVTVLDWAADDTAPPAQHFGVAPAEIRDNPNEYRGETVTVSGEVNQVLDPFAFTIGGEQWVNGGEILIIGPPPHANGAVLEEEDPLQAADIVQVHGTVRDFDDIDFEDEFDEQVNVDALQDYAGQPVIVSEGTIIAARMRADVGDLIDVEDLAADPEDRLGDRVTVIGDITNVGDDGVFVLEDQVAVIDATTAMTAEALEGAEAAEVSGDFVERDAAVGLVYDDVTIGEEHVEGIETEYVLVAVSILLLPEEAADGL
jgi:hypothetical protein